MLVEGGSGGPGSNLVKTASTDAKTFVNDLLGK